MKKQGSFLFDGEKPLFCEKEKAGYWRSVLLYADRRQNVTTHSHFMENRRCAIWKTNKMSFIKRGKTCREKRRFSVGSEPKKRAAMRKSFFVYTIYGVKRKKNSYIQECQKNCFFQKGLAIYTVLGYYSSRSLRKGKEPQYIVVLPKSGNYSKIHSPVFLF